MPRFTCRPRFGAGSGVARWAAVPAAALAMIGALPAPPAQAGGRCTLGFCSQTYNAGPIPALARYHWRCGGTTGTESEDPSCTSGPSMWLSAHQSTPGAEDWDTLQIDAGWCYKVRFQLPYKTWTLRYDRRGVGPSWVKIEDHGIATVLVQSMHNCP